MQVTYPQSSITLLISPHWVTYKKMLSAVCKLRYSSIYYTNNELDVLVVVKEVGELGQITGKTSQKPVYKRDLTIVDVSKFSCRLTLWGKQAENFNVTDQPVVAFKGVKVGDFGGMWNEGMR